MHTQSFHVYNIIFLGRIFPQMMREELASLQEHISVMRDISQHMRLDPRDHKDAYIRDTIGNLSDRISALEAESDQRRLELQSSDRSYHEFEDELRVLEAPLAEVQQKLSVVLMNTAPLEEQLADLEVSSFF